jgi:hypothetical protein
MTEKVTRSVEERTLTALEDMAHDVRGIYLLVSLWFALSVLGIIIWLIAR